MSHTISGKLFKAPFIKQLGESTMFAIKLAEVTKDRQTGEKSYVNYEAVLFAKTAAAIDFYTSATAEGSFVVVSCEKLQMKVSPCGKYTSLSMENARLENASYSQGSPQQPQQNAPQQQSAPAQQQAPQMAPAYQPQPAPQHAPQNQGATNNQPPYDPNEPPF